MKPNHYQVIIVEGLIGAGKSELAKELALQLEGNTRLALEPDERDGVNPYLASYYADPAGYAFKMQMRLLAVRYKIHMLSQWYVENGEGHAVIDRSYFGDTCFARLQLQLGYMTQDDFDTYHMTVANDAGKVKMPHVCLFLMVDPETSARRIQSRYEQREGRACEVAIDLEYLEMLSQQYDILLDELEKSGVRVIRVPWDVEREDTEKRAQAVRSLARQIERYKAPDPFLRTLTRHIFCPETKV